MPPCGRRNPLPDSLPPARRELAQEMRNLLRLDGGSLRSIAKRANCSHSALHRLTSGEVCSPDWGIISRVRAAVERKNPVGVVTEEHLRRLVQQVWDEDPHNGAGPAENASEPADAETPTVGTSAPSVAPVLPVGGDRRNGPTAEALWPVDELIQHLNSGRYEHAVGMLNYAGGKAPAEEAAAAIQACRDRGLTDATDALIRMVGGRPADIAMTVIGHLFEFNNDSDAKALLRICCANDRYSHVLQG